MDTSIAGNARAGLGLLAGIAVAFVTWVAGLLVLDQTGISGAIPSVAFALVAYFVGVKTRNMIVKSKAEQAEQLSEMKD